MASPLPTRKKSVDLGSGEVRVSRIRRDPPPPEKPKELRHPDVVNRSAVAIGVLVFALAIVVILIAFSIFSGYNMTPRQVTLHV
ncbi:hypothetical protein LZ496_10155 [Sphingomonas sp. NSE70-1]|uniref:Uncharacterized protein n=1 Tax=Sphingomonas caseinilyticus TaxID=2908205 RepID=A0ABT0RVS6_9SPHN|nr:hypothetical protein [Sphingomonas caseinilyticus]MCL6699139.1 hypothetical protein [Sphingomonas caseinilyticus]